MADAWTGSPYGPTFCAKYQQRGEESGKKDHGFPHALFKQPKFSGEKINLGLLLRRSRMFALSEKESQEADMI